MTRAVTTCALSAVPARLRPIRRCQRREHLCPFQCAPLEPRLLLANAVLSTDLGQLGPGRVFQANELIPSGAAAVPVHVYTFTLAAAADVDVVTSFHPLGGFAGPPDGYIVLSAPGAAEPFGTVFNSASGRAEFKQHFSAGSYELRVESDGEEATFDLALNVDGAPGAFAFANSTSDFDATKRTSLGSLPASTPTTVNDFVGYLRTSNDPALDAIDTYTFTNPLFGSLKVNLDQLVPDDAGGRVSVNVGLYADFDHDGLFKANELLASATNLSSSGTFTANVNAGPYALVVSSTIASGSTGVLGGSNYRLTLNYTPADNAGGLPQTARNIGTLGLATMTFTDYLSAPDTADVYRFDTVAGGPFQFHADISSPGGGVFAYDLLTPAVGKSGLTQFDTLATTTVTGSTPGSLSFLINNPGTYYFRARRISGEGAYTVALINTTTDRAGNTLASARNLIDLFGKATLPDFVGTADPIDLYKFTLTQSTVVTASIPASPTGTAAGLSILQDINGNGLIDKRESVGDANNTGSTARTVTRTLAAGTYYVEVFQITGAVSYDLSLIVDTAGALVNRARTLTLVNGQTTVEEYVGPEDTTDVYKFTVSAPVQINAFLNFLSNPIDVSFAQDTNGDNFISFNEILAHQTLTDFFDARVSANLLAAGTYEMLIGSADPDGSNYGMVLATAPVDNAGNSLADARPVTLGSSAQAFSDVVGNFGAIPDANDPDDFYRFTPGTNGPYEFIAQMPSVNGLAGMELIYDANNNQQVDPGEVLGTVASTGLNQPTPPIVTALTLPGNYYLHVFANNAAYLLTMQAISLDGVGNTLGTARALAGTSASEFVGRTDPDDFYSFTAAGPGELRAQLTGSNPLISMDIIRDANNNGVVDPGEILGTTNGLGGGIDLLDGVILPAAGTYFVHVQANGAESNYSLVLTQSTQAPLTVPAQILIATPTVIQAEDFDLGGEGVAYHDTTSGNAGGAYRVTEAGGPVGVDIFPTADSGGGFRVDNTAAGEFLEYTLNVATAGTYNFDFRVGSTGTGAQFHAEIDGVNVTGEKDTPGQLPADTFATVTTTNVVLTAGPHLLRFVFDRNNTSGPANAGALNFITIRPSTGTFVLTPPAPVATPGQSTPLSLGWTVPAADWHFLNTIDIRLTGDDGSQIWLRFNEADQTLALYNPHSRKFGPAKKIGSHDHLSDGLVDIDLSASSVVAAGPTSPTVTLNLALTFSAPAADTDFLIDVAAANDAGFVQAFEPAGTLHVLGRTHGRGPHGN